MLLIGHFVFRCFMKYILFCARKHSFILGPLAWSKALRPSIKDMPLIGPFSFPFFILGSVVYHNLELSHEHAHPENSARLSTTLSVTEVTCCPFLNAKDGETGWNFLTSHFCLNRSAFLNGRQIPAIGCILDPCYKVSAILTGFI